MGKHNSPPFWRRYLCEKLQNFVVVCTRWYNKKCTRLLSYIHREQVVGFISSFFVILCKCRLAVFFYTPLSLPALAVIHLKLLYHIYYYGERERERKPADKFGREHRLMPIFSDVIISPAAPHEEKKPSSISWEGNFYVRGWGGGTYLLYTKFLSITCKKD